MKKLILITLTVILISGCGKVNLGNYIETITANTTTVSYVTDTTTLINIAILEMSDENLYKVFNETRLSTDINNKVWKELKRRGYWDKDEKEDEQKAIEVLNKYSNLDREIN
jgi:ABC-type glutathione transport system ATPase component